MKLESTERKFFFFKEKDLEALRFQLFAIWWNVWDWMLTLVEKYTKDPKNNSKTTPDESYQFYRTNPDPKWTNYHVAIIRPGSSKQVKFRKLEENEATVGYNIPGLSTKGNCCIARWSSSNSPSGKDTKETKDKELPADTVLVKVSHFSVNYADVCIRWGLYDSASKFVGWPICPGFDISGTVEWVGNDHADNLNVGDEVFGCTLFGGYSTRVLVPGRQLRKIPVLKRDGKTALLTAPKAAAIPAACFTAMHALNLAGFMPGEKIKPRNNLNVLIHSAAGGVGSMLCLMSCYLGMEHVIGVVGRPEKKGELEKLVAHSMKNTDTSKKSSSNFVVIEKKDLWCKDILAAGAVGEGKKQDSNASKSTEILDRCFNRDGFCGIFDANGIETLGTSYDHVAQGGRLIVYGFHTNLPTVSESLNPLNWLKMAFTMFGRMPHFDPMLLTVESKGVLGFNLSFFAQEVGMLGYYFDELVRLVEIGVVGEDCVKVEQYEMSAIRDAHDRISSGKSVGKIVLTTGA